MIGENAVNAVVAIAVAPEDRFMSSFGTWIAAVAPDGDLEAVLDAASSRLGATSVYRLFHALSLVYWRLGDSDQAMGFFHRCIIPENGNRATDEPVSSGYAHAYDDFEVHRVAVAAFMDFAGPFLVGRGTMVDAGCGTGLAASALRPLADRLVGLDLSPDMVARARARDLYDEVAEGDMIALLQARPASVDTVLCNGSTCYLPRLAPFVAACARALKPGGMLVFSDFSAPEELGLGITCGGTLRHCRSESYVRALAAQQEFAVEAVEPGLSYNIPCLFWALRRI